MKKETIKLFKRFIFTLILGLCFNVNIFGQAVSINTTGNAPDGSAMLDISATNKGVLIPRVQLDDATTADPVTSPADGLMIYNATGTEPKGLYVWDATDAQWKQLYNGTVPSVPGETEYWLRPASDPTYIYPEGNDKIKVYDAGQTYGLYYDGGTNQYGLYGRTTNVVDPTAAVVGFSDVTGNQTYGYLGYNGTYDSGTGFGSLSGMAVYGSVDDPSRAAGFFRTTGNASVASLISYSDTWLASFNYVDNIDNASNPSCSFFYLNDSVSMSYSNEFQNAILTLSEYNGGSASNTNWSTGAYLQGFANGDQSAAGAVCVGSAGSAYWGFGVYASGSDYGVYTSNGNTLTKNKNNISYGSGLVSDGDLYGALIKGNVYGSYISGREYSAYFNGVQYSNNLNVQLVDNNTSERVVTFVPVTETADIILRGQGKLINGKATVKFDSKMVSIISKTDPIYVTVTPTSATQGIYVTSSKNSGFEVVENNNGKSSATFNWIAIVTRKDYQDFDVDKAVINTNYDYNFKSLFGDMDKVSHNKEMYWDGNKLIYGTIPVDIKDTRSEYFDNNLKKTLSKLSE